MCQLSGFGLSLFTVGLLVVARLVLAMMLAIAPLMAGFALFAGTRGMAEGWLRAMVAAALVPLFVLTLLAVELALLSPLLSRLLAEQAAGRYENASVTPIGLVVLVFAAATIAAAAAGGRIAAGIRLSGAPVRPGAGEAGPEAQPDRPMLPERAAPAGIARAITLSATRRDADPPAAQAALIASAFARPPGRGDAGTAAAPAGQAGTVPGARPALTLQRLPRRSRAAARRDR
jgi:type IV secretion system protein VirB6